MASGLLLWAAGFATGGVATGLGMVAARRRVAEPGFGSAEVPQRARLAAASEPVSESAALSGVAAAALDIAEDGTVDHESADTAVHETAPAAERRAGDEEDPVGGGVPTAGNGANGASATGGAWSGDPRVDRAMGALPLGVVVTDTDGRDVYRNHFAEQFHGARHADALVEAAIGEVITIALAGQTTERPIDLYGPPARSLLLRAMPTLADEGPTGTVVVIEDVTLNQQVDRVRRDFVANVSHELRTPIGAIGLLAETLRDADDPDVVDRLAGRLHNEALRLGDMIDDLLALSRLETGQVEEPDTVDLHQAVRAAVERAASAAEQREITIEIVPFAGGSVLVDGDQGQMVSAVANLLDNAVKYSDRGETVSASLDRDDEHCRVTVSDRGVGIPESALNRIFERFYRVDDARSRATGGTGLGLSIVRHVVLNHGGTISVESTEGEGSSFTIELPISGLHRSGLVTRTSRGVGSR